MGVGLGPHHHEAKPWPAVCGNHAVAAAFFNILQTILQASLNGFQAIMTLRTIATLCWQFWKKKSHLAYQTEQARGK